VWRVVEEQQHAAAPLLRHLLPRQCRGRGGQAGAQPRPRPVPESCVRVRGACHSPWFPGHSQLPRGRQTWRDQPQLFPTGVLCQQPEGTWSVHFRGDRHFAVQQLQLHLAANLDEHRHGRVGVARALLHHHSRSLRLGLGRHPGPARQAGGDQDRAGERRSSGAGASFYSCWRELCSTVDREA